MAKTYSQHSSTVRPDVRSVSPPLNCLNIPVHSGLQSSFLPADSSGASTITSCAVLVIVGSRSGYSTHVRSSVAQAAGILWGLASLRQPAGVRIRGCCNACPQSAEHAMCLPSPGLACRTAWLASSAFATELVPLMKEVYAWHKT